MINDVFEGGEVFVAMADLLDPAWMEWYKAKHRERYLTLSGDDFEQYVTRTLALEYLDFVNPTPMGQSGDGGCDGAACAGRLLFACYGQRAKANQDSKTTSKFKHDFNRALEVWDGFDEWQFVTNASFGPGPTKALIGFQREHGPKSMRPLIIRVIATPEQFWGEHVSKLSIDKLDQLFPGVPHAQSVELDDLVKLIVSLEGLSNPDDGNASDLRPVSVKKMDYNQVSEINRCELNVGRLMSQRVERWFSEQPDPELRDEKAAAFNRIYLRAKEQTDDPSEIFSRIYIALAGTNFALSRKRANAAYAVTAYFFDTCDIFERVPEEEQ